MIGRRYSILGVVLAPSAVALLTASVALASTSPLCAIVEDTSLHQDVNESSAAFTSYGDVFAGTSTNWTSSPNAERYVVTSSPPVALTPAQIVERLRVLEQAVASSSAFASTQPNGDRLRAALLEELGILRARVLPFTASVEVSWSDAQQFVSSQFDSQSVPALACTGGMFSTDTAFFNDRDGDGDGVPDAQLALRFYPKNGPIVEHDEPIYFANLDQAIELRAVTTQVQALFSPLQAIALNLVRKRLAEVDQAWANYLEKGYSQYPWEALLNAWVMRFTWVSPPHGQIVLVHPEVGVIFDARGTGDRQFDGSLLVHGVGYIHYWGDKRSFFTGLSATGSMTTSSEVGLGAGGSLHIGHAGLFSRVPHLTLSVLWQDTETGKGGPFVGVNVDLWRLLERGFTDRRFQSVLERR